MACINYFINGFNLFLTDKDLKKIWEVGMQISPHEMCESHNRRLKLMPGKWNFDRAYHHYLLQEKPFFDSCCAPVVKNYDERLIEKFEEIDLYFRDNIKMGDVTHQKIREDYRSEIFKYLDQKNTYPGRSVTSYIWEGVACKVLCLSNYSTLEKYKPLVDEAVKTKDLKPQFLAALMDRMHYLKTGKQIYGTLYRSTNSEKILIPLENETRLDIKRKTMGLTSLDTFIKKNKIRR